MTRQLTSRSTLDNLKAEAKRWLKALRANDESAQERLARADPGSPNPPALRDIQLALALEHGFAGWTDLKTSLAKLSTQSTLHHYEALAAALLEAYRTGNPEAMQRLAEHQG